MKKNTPPQQLRHEAPESRSEVSHIPVLLEDTIRLLAPRVGQTYLDLTAGYGGHASKIADVTGEQNVTLVDRDDFAIASLQPFAEKGARLIHDDFLAAAEMLAAENTQFDMILVDLGVSSPQLDRAERGFSIKRNGPLDMRMDRRQELTAETIVNRWSKTELITLLESYGEERRGAAERIALAIIKARPLTTTFELAAAVLSAHRGKYQSVHPATRTFQAIRIACNDELRQVRELMPLIPSLLKPKGRVCIISFHSLEDRIVKQYFSEMAASGYEAELTVTEKAIRGAINDVHNPRSRSAILRSAVKK